MVVERPTLWRRLREGLWRSWHRPDWPAFAGVDYLATILERPVTDRHHAKQGRSTGRLVLRAHRSALVVYLKRHYRLSWMSGLLAQLFPNHGWSPACVEQRHLEWAHEHGIPAPAVVAAGEAIGPGLRFQSYLAIEELTGMVALNELLPIAARRLTPATFRRWKAGLAAELARLARQLHGLGYYHQDLYLCHFYVHAKDIGRLGPWAGRVFLIDWHRLARQRWTGWYGRIKDLAQLAYSAELPEIDVRDRLHFWREYMGIERHASSGRRLQWAVRAKARRYARHNAPVESRSVDQAA